MEKQYIEEDIAQLKNLEMVENDNFFKDIYEIDEEKTEVTKQMRDVKLVQKETNRNNRITSGKLSWVKVGVLVNHKIFGEGIVEEIEDGYISISFGNAEKRFQFPQSFENGFFEIV